MGYSKPELLVSTLLNCGVCDLDSIYGIGYDLNDILETLKTEGIDVSWVNIMNEAFSMARMELNDAVNIPGFKESTLERMEEARQAIKDGEYVTTDYTCEEITLEDIDGHEKLLEDGLINPEQDMSWYLNYLDTHMMLKHLDFYRTWMEDELDQLEANTGFEFEDT